MVPPWWWDRGGLHTLVAPRWYCELCQAILRDRFYEGNSEQGASASSSQYVFASLRGMCSACAACGGFSRRKPMTVVSSSVVLPTGGALAESPCLIHEVPRGENHVHYKRAMVKSSWHHALLGGVASRDLAWLAAVLGWQPSLNDSGGSVGLCSYFGGSVAARAKV